jgi:16S rRNA C1402 (ribose-2'-O) methylase RsmI
MSIRSHAWEREILTRLGLTICIESQIFNRYEKENSMTRNDTELTALLKDMIKLNAVIATELIQLVENSSRQLRGEIPASCKAQHGTLKKEIVAIAEKWHDNCGMLAAHNLSHG